MRTDKNRFLHLPFIFCLILIFSTAVYGQNGDIPADAVVTVVGGGGYPVEDESIYNGGGMDDFGAVYSASRDLFISLKDVYITDNLTVITLTLGTSRSASTYNSSSAVFINGEQRAGGGGAGEAAGEPYTRTMTLAFYGGVPDTKLGSGWDSLRVSLDGLVFAAYEGTDSGYIGVPEGYTWSHVFHNPEVSRYNSDEFASAVDGSGIHTYGNRVEIELAGFSADGDLSFDFVRKSDLLNMYGSQNAVWINDRQQGGGGSSVFFDADGNPEVDADTKFVQTDHFLYQDIPEAFHPDSLAVWAQAVTLELTQSGTPRTWTLALNENLFPMKLVQFYNLD